MAESKALWFSKKDIYRLHCVAGNLRIGIWWTPLENFETEDSWRCVARCLNCTGTCTMARSTRRPPAGLPRTKVHMSVCATMLLSLLNSVLALCQVMHFHHSVKINRGLFRPWCMNANSCYREGRALWFLEVDLAHQPVSEKTKLRQRA